MSLQPRQREVTEIKLKRVASIPNLNGQMMNQQP